MRCDRYPKIELVRLQLLEDDLAILNLLVDDML